MYDKPIDTVDYLFIGLGAANCLLLFNMHKCGLLFQKEIAIIEPKSDNLNEHNFCFWSNEEELTKLNLETLVSTKWERIKVAGRSPQSISPLRYFHIKGIDLCSTVKEILVEHRAKFYAEAFLGEPYVKSKTFLISLVDSSIIAHHVFDSRPPTYQLTEKNQSHLLQSFYGWTLKTGDYNFDQSTIVMMDFDIPQNNFFQFVYILPFTRDKALFEVTRFGKEKISKNEALKILNEYVTRYGFSYQVLEEEKGVIPMSSATIFNPNYGSNWTNTGARASMIKPTTGYAFHNMAIDAKKISESILSQQPFLRHEGYTRFKFYDGLLLKILEETPQLGKQIFQNLFDYAPIKIVLNFLSEKSILSHEVFIFSKLPVFIFLHVAFKDIVSRISSKISRISPTSLALVTTISMLGLSFFSLEKILYLLLIIGFFSIGLSHGAVDHMINEKNNGYKQLLRYSLRYIAKGALLGLFWIFLPDIALILFLIFSAWHFGQADFREWNLNHGFNSFLWGALVILSILFFHLEETIAVLESIEGLNMHHGFYGLQENKLIICKIAIVFCSIVIAAVYKSKQMLLTLCYLLLSSFLPLIVSFGIYFVLQHSLNGWRHLKSGLKMNSYNLWLKSLPFSAGGALVISMFMLAESPNNFSLFFILLSCMSLPHIMSMNQFYVHSIKN